MSLCPALFDLFLDLPHPAASKSCPPERLIWHNDPNEQLRSLPDLANTISRFAFPEYTAGGAAEAEEKQQTLLRLNKYDYYAMQSSLSSFQHFTFTLQLQDGMRLHGHVRRCLPATPLIEQNDGNNNNSKYCPRYDVGRRGERALVLLTRAGGADRLSEAILKSIQALQALQQATGKENANKDTIQGFLFALAAQQQRLATVYAKQPAQERGKPLVAMLHGLELDNSRHYNRVDVHRFLVPPSLLQLPTSPSQPSENTTTSTQQPDIMAACSILPLLRCVGIAHALRIFSALLCERRVILVSASPTRLTNCSHAVLAMLSCGQLPWQHLYIPVLPPHMWQYLAAPYPYLIGVLHSSGSGSQQRLDQTDGLGEVMILNLDSNRMEARGMDPNVIAQRLPDLFQTPEMTVAAMALTSPTSSSMTGTGETLAASSASEFLAQDLTEVLKLDKRLLYGEASFQQNVGETATKALKQVKSAVSKLRIVGRMYLQQTRSSFNERDASSGEQGGAGSGDDENTPSSEQYEEQSEVNSMAADYIYTEGCHNETCEAEARVAFTMFFLCLFGNMRWYLGAPSSNGQAPQLDRQRFLQQKRAMGDGEGTPMWLLLQGFCQSQIFQEHVKAQVELVQSRQPLTPDAPLFSQCAQYHRQRNLDFGILQVRSTCRQIWQQRQQANNSNDARSNAMNLTSNKANEGDYNRAVAALVEECRESTCVLTDVMSVLWLRLRDCKGGQWKHGYLALQILRNLLYHGPLAAVAEATDGLDTIRRLKFYENSMRQTSANQVRGAAQLVYSLLVDRSRLFSIRRFCAHRRWELLQNKNSNPVRDRRMVLTAPFRSLHNLASPTAGGTVVRMPPANQTHGRGGSSNATVRPTTQQQPPPPMDLLGMSTPVATATVDDIFGLATPSSSNAVANDMLGMFGGMTVSHAAPPTTTPPPSGPPPQQQQQQSPFYSPQARTPSHSPVPSGAPSAPQQPQLGHPPPQYAQQQRPTQHAQPHPTYAQLPPQQQQPLASQGQKQPPPMQQQPMQAFGHAQPNQPYGAPPLQQQQPKYPPQHQVYPQQPPQAAGQQQQQQHRPPPTKQQPQYPPGAAVSQQYGAPPAAGHYAVNYQQPPPQQQRLADPFGIPQPQTPSAGYNPGAPQQQQQQQRVNRSQFDPFA